MAAQIKFLAGPNFVIPDLAGSGLAFFGDPGFGAAIAVGSWQGHTYISDSNGSTQGAESNNTKFLNSQSGVLGQAGSGINIRNFPNYQCPLAIEFSNDTPVQAKNGVVRIYDRVSIDNPPSGIVFKAAEIIHPDPSQAVQGSGNSVWSQVEGSGSVLSLAQSPGVSGLYAGNGLTSTRPDLSHRWHLALSCSPSQIGSKLASLYVYVEYL